MPPQFIEMFHCRAVAPKNNGSFHESMSAWIAFSPVSRHLISNYGLVIQPSLDTHRGFFIEAASHRMPEDS
jgi:hypothetical protein